MMTMLQDERCHVRETVISVFSTLADEGDNHHNSNVQVILITTFLQRNLPLKFKFQQSFNRCYCFYWMNVKILDLEQYLLSLSWQNKVSG